MKKLLTVIILVLAAAIITPAVSAAETDEMPLGVYSVVTDDDCSEQLIGAPDSGDIEDAQEYELYIDRKEVLSVGASGSSSKRFHAEFMIPGTSYEVYLAGLRAENIEEIQQEIIDVYVDGEPFDFNNLDFIDAEKLVPGNSDSNLCWAASCSNMLVYTGWAQQAGFDTEDEVFDLYNKSFKNEGGFQHYGLGWFFNGVAMDGNILFPGSYLRDYPNSGRYFNNYAYDMVSNCQMIRSVTQLNHMEELLKSGCAISPGIDLYRNGSYSGSHAITLWGFVTDASLEKTDINRFRQVFITDSDSDMTQRSDRTLSDNIMNMKPTYANDRGQLCFDYDETLSSAFSDYTYLLPYSSSIPQETDKSAKRNKIRYADLCFGQVSLSDKRYEAEQKTLYESGTKVYFNFDVLNAADKTYRSSVNVKRNVVNEKGETLLNDTVNVSSFRLNAAATTSLNYGELGKLPAGDYKLTLKVSERPLVAEAYYYNNNFTLDFKIRDSYLLGDCNSDAQISIGDATEVQRLIAGIYDDGKAAERGNVNGGDLDISDATSLQRYLAKFDTDEPIGAKQLHTII